MADARRFGLPAEAMAEIAAALAGDRGDFSGLWPDNLLAVEAFAAAATQWRTALAVEEGRMRTMFLGLDYAGAAVAWTALGILPDRDLWWRLAQIEAAARDALNGSAA